MSTQTITINGKSYDAVTGKLITTSHKNVEKTSEKKSTKVSVAVATVTKPTVRKTVAKHTPKPSQTLMRSAVKKPVSKQLVRVQHELTANDMAVAVRPKPSVNTVSHARLERAKAVVRNEQISKFNHKEPKTNLTVQHAVVPVRRAPAATASTDESIDTPAPKRTNVPDDMFTRAIANASHHVDIKSHSKAYKRKARRHFVSMASGVLALLVIAGFAAYLNTPSLQIQVAGLQAGVSTANHNFSKTPFRYAGVSSSPTHRTISLKTADAQYQLIEQPTNWDGSHMIDNISSKSANGDLNYDAMLVDGLIVYRLNNGNATWVKDGTWYQLNGERAVSDQALQSLVQNS